MQFSVARGAYCSVGSARSAGSLNAPAEGEGVRVGVTYEDGDGLTFAGGELARSELPRPGRDKNQ